VNLEPWHLLVVVPALTVTLAACLSLLYVLVLMALEVMLDDGAPARPQGVGVPSGHARTPVAPGADTPADHGG